VCCSSLEGNCHTTKTGLGSDTDIIFQNRIGFDSKNPLFGHLFGVQEPDFGIQSSRKLDFFGFD